jgi:transcriptional regulator with XRE-family HTH domain
MDIFSKQIRARAAELGLSNADIARRAGLTERRYSHYVTGAREPDLATLVRIADVLGTTTDELLGRGGQGAQNKRSALSARLLGAANMIPQSALEILVLQAEALAARLPWKK